MKKKTLIIEIISFLYILLFVYAAIAKLIDYEKFRVQLDQSPLLMAFSGWVAWAVPLSEIIIAFMLMSKRFQLAGFYAAFFMMVMFTAYIIVILNFADHVPCSCGGILESMGWTEHLIFNIVFVLFALTGIILLNRQSTGKHPAQSAAIAG